jgi:hypothetical protein
VGRALLEGSRLARTPLTKRYLFCDLLGRNGCETGGPRERPGAWLLLAYRTEMLGQRTPLGNSRAPPAFTFPSRNTDRARHRQVLRHALKRLPSGCPPNHGLSWLLNSGSWLLFLELPSLRQNLFALLFGLGIVLLGILHGETFFDQAATLLFFAHLHIDLTKSDVVH